MYKNNGVNMTIKKYFISIIVLIATTVVLVLVSNMFSQNLIIGQIIFFINIFNILGFSFYILGSYIIDTIKHIKKTIREIKEIRK